MDSLIYDLEIVNAIPARGRERLPGVKYAESWEDHAGMGISVIGVYDYVEDRYRVFCEDNFGAFRELADERRLLVGFNNIRFDNAVIAAELDFPIADDHCYDILRELWAAAGFGPKFDKSTHTGFGLDKCCEVNFGTRKSGHGAYAPVQWQRGEFGAVIDYCLNDVRLTKMLFDKIIYHGEVADPRGSGVLAPRGVYAMPRPPV